MYPILDTRVECKVYIMPSVTQSDTIRIEPDWNVNRVHQCVLLPPYFLLEYNQIGM